MIPVPAHIRGFYPYKHAYTAQAYTCTTDKMTTESEPSTNTLLKILTLSIAFTCKTDMTMKLSARQLHC